MRFSWLSCVLLGSLLLQDSRPAAGPEVGKPAPAFRLNDQTGQLVAFGGKSESWTVIAFYPKASTSGCTREVCSLRDAATDLSATGARVLGISLDSVVAQAEFAKAQKLDYPLLSDPDGSVAAKYGVLMAEKGIARRVTFLVDDQGVLRCIDDHVDVEHHGADLVRKLKELRGQ